MLNRYENGTALPPPLSAPKPEFTAGSSAAIAIPGVPANRGLGGNSGALAMESDDDSTFPISRSWDDIEGARRYATFHSSPFASHTTLFPSLIVPLAFLSYPSPGPLFHHARVDWVCFFIRSILNLNSPNGFHPMMGMGSMLGGGSFSLPTAASRSMGPRPGGVFGT